MSLAYPWSMRLPDCLETRHDRAVTYLRRYYSVRRDPELRRSTSWYSGAYFDRWPDDPADAAPDEFTVDDVVALTYLSVSLPAEAALTILRWRAEELAELLAQIGPDRDLKDEPAGSINEQWPAWKLETALRRIPGIGPVRASKLIARKRPRLYPIYDKVVDRTIRTNGRILQPLHRELSMNPHLTRTLQDVREAAGLPDTVSELRVFDVLAWMEGKQAGQ